MYSMFDTPDRDGTKCSEESDSTDDTLAYDDDKWRSVEHIKLFSLPVDTSSAPFLKDTQRIILSPMMMPGRSLAS